MRETGETGEIKKFFKIENRLQNEVEQADTPIQELFI